MSSLTKYLIYICAYAIITFSICKSSEGQTVHLNIARLYGQRARHDNSPHEVDSLIDISEQQTASRMAERLQSFADNVMYGNRARFFGRIGILCTVLAGESSGTVASLSVDTAVVALGGAVLSKIFQLQGSSVETIPGHENVPDVLIAAPYGGIDQTTDARALVPSDYVDIISF